jgi:ABC-type phosphate transport system substrate-binding protein
MKLGTLSTFLSIVVAAAHSTVFDIHGSGTTNPSKCIWHIMSLIEDRSLVQSRLTYRAVGSSTGIKEFLGVNNTAATVTGPFQHIPHTDFGSGDVPIPTEDYLALKEANNGADKFMVHLPFAISSVSFFHGLPGVPSADTSPDGLKLSPCTLARIFNGKISQWDDPEIIETNPKLISMLQSSWGKPENGYNIFVARRVKGSSSTDSITRVGIISEF